MMRTRAITAPLLALGLLAPGQAAQAGTVKLNSTCYVEGQGMGVSGTGFAPNASITLSGSGVFATVATDGTGAFVTVLRAPVNGTIGGTAKDIVSNTLEVRNYADPTQDTSIGYRVTNLAFTVANSGGKPRSKRRFNLSGFPRGSTVWAHYRFGGRTLGTVRFGKAQGDCGLVTVQMALLPAKVPLRYGTWKVQWDTKRTYKATTKPRLTTSLSIFRTFR